MCNTCDGVGRIYVENSYSMTIKPCPVCKAPKKEEEKVA
jgi:excinuclease UvrABC ATPase subunit